MFLKNHFSNFGFKSGEYMKRLFVFMLVLALGINFAGCKKGTSSTGDVGENTAGPNAASIATIDGEQISVKEFKKAYFYHLKMNYSSGRQEILREDKDEMKKYFQAQFLPERLFVKYAVKLEKFKKDNLLERAKAYFSKAGLITYSTFLNVQSKYQEPNDNALKQFYSDLKSQNAGRIKQIVAKLAALPWNKRRLGLMQLHSRSFMNRTTMEYVNKIRQENRVIMNDDLEKDVIKKYLNDEIPMDKVLSDDSSLWLLKFNKRVVTVQEVEKEIRLLMLLNFGQTQLDKYLKESKSRKSYRKIFWESGHMQWLIYLDALKKKLDKTEDGKFFINKMIRTSLSKIYMMDKISSKIPDPTNEEIKKAYAKLKQARRNIPALNNEVREYISHQLKQQRGNAEMMKLFSKLQGRHIIKTNDKFFVAAELREGATGSSSNRAASSN
jgi:hypothetical protein